MAKTKTITEGERDAFLAEAFRDMEDRILNLHAAVLAFNFLSEEMLKDASDTSVLHTIVLNDEQQEALSYTRHHVVDLSRDLAEHFNTQWEQAKSPPNQPATV